MISLTRHLDLKADAARLIEVLDIRQMLKVRIPSKVARRVLADQLSVARASDDDQRRRHCTKYAQVSEVVGRTREG